MLIHIAFTKIKTIYATPKKFTGSSLKCNSTYQIILSIKNRIFVLGHQDCGAVKSAIKDVEMGNITSLMEDIKPSVEQTKYEGERTYANEEFFNAVIAENILQTIEEIKQNSPILKDLEQEGKIKICGAVYEIATGRIRFLK